MRAHNVMTRDVLCMPAALRIESAYRVMLKHSVRHIPVVEAGRLVGIVSDRDLLLHAEHCADGSLAFSPLTLAKVMTPFPVTCEHTTTVSDMAKLLIQHKIDSLPIVGLNDGLIGLVTSTDLLELLVDDDRLQVPIPFEFDLRVVDEAAVA